MKQREPSAKLIYYLNSFGFELYFPTIKPEEAILTILKSDNSRLYFAIPLLLKEDLNFDLILSKLNSNEKNELKRIILITLKIEKQENMILIKNRDILKKIKLNKEQIKPEIIELYKLNIIDALKKKKINEENKIKRDIQIISKFNTNDSLKKIFSDGKIRILNKIYNHEKLTKTEIEYYYRSISPLCESILNQNLQAYCKIIQTTKKYRE